MLTYYKTEVATDIFFHIVTYIRVKQIIENKNKCSWFSPSVVDWTEAALNASLHSIVRKGRS